MHPSFPPQPPLVTLAAAAAAIAFALADPASAAAAPAVDPGPAWPQANGPAGNFTPRRAGVELVDDPSQARQVWLSEDRDLGYAKGSVSGYLQNLARWDGHPGSAAGPILAGGTLFVTTFRPSGEPRALKQPQLPKLKASKTPLTEAEQKRLHDNLRILADDLLVAIDAATGQTVWKAAEEDVGLNRYMGKRGGYNVSPAYHHGRVFSLGTTGLLRAYRAADGERLWEVGIGAARAAALERRAESLQKQVLPGGMGWNSSLTVAGGVLVVPLFEGKSDNGLRGVKPETGETLWEVAAACSRWATPAVWANRGKTYTLTATYAGALHLIDPADGGVLWTVDGLGPNQFSLAPTAGNLVCVNAGSNRLRREGKTQKYGRLAAYRLSLKGGERAWAHPEDPRHFFSTWMDNCARRFLAVDRGRIYYRAHGLDKGQSRLLILDEETGKVIAESPLNSPAPHFYPVEDKLFMIRDACHSDTDLGLFTTDPEDFRMTTPEYWRPPHQATTAYEVLMEHPTADGHLFLRTKDGRIACYDFRKRP